MIRPDLKLVEPEPKPETVAQRVRRLTAEAKALARDHVAQMLATLSDLEATAKEIASGGPAYAPGAVAVARDIVLSCERHALTLAAINGRQT